jgi:hypothetical protein
MFSIFPFYTDENGVKILEDLKIHSFSDVAGTIRREFVNVNEQSSAGITRIEGQQALVAVLLQAATLVARHKSAARSAVDQARLNPLGLRDIVDVLDDDSPLAHRIDRTHWPAVNNFGRTYEASSGTHPVAFVVRVAVVQGIVEILLIFVKTFDQRLS